VLGLTSHALRVRAPRVVGLVCCRGYALYRVPFYFYSQWSELGTSAKFTSQKRIRRKSTRKAKTSAKAADRGKFLKLTFKVLLKFLDPNHDYLLFVGHPTPRKSRIRRQLLELTKDYWIAPIRHWQNSFQKFLGLDPYPDDFQNLLLASVFNW